MHVNKETKMKSQKTKIRAVATDANDNSLYLNTLEP